MSKIGVAVGEDFPLQDLSAAWDPTQDSQSTAGARSDPAREEDEQAEFARWKWRREGQRLWDEDVRNQRADWEAKKRAFKEKIRTVVHDAVNANENQRHHRWRHSWRSAWPSIVGIGIAALALAIHRRNHHRHAGRCHYYDDADIETPSRRSSPHDNGEPIITPPPPREH